jgi:hypothetical protein
LPGFDAHKDSIDLAAAEAKRDAEIRHWEVLQVGCL